VAPFAPFLFSFEPLDVFLVVPVDEESFCLIVEVGRGGRARYELELKGPWDPVLRSPKLQSLTLLTLLMTLVEPAQSGHSRERKGPPLLVLSKKGSDSVALPPTPRVPNPDNVNWDVWYRHEAIQSQRGKYGEEGYQKRCERKIGEM